MVCDSYFDSSRYPIATTPYADRFFLAFWDFAVEGGFLTAAFAAWASPRSRSKRNFDEVLPELAVVHDSTACFVRR